ncbi:MAG: GNAT family N-acetyltransferase [Candidatus Acidiferrales bacterium]
MESEIHIREAVPTDIPVLSALIDASVRALQAEDYTPAQMEGALKTVFGVDSRLIADGTYFVAETDYKDTVLARLRAASSAPFIVGCGGWSKRKTLYGSDQWTGRQDELLDPRHDAAKIRAFFIHPEWARRGIGSMILDVCESAARSAGFGRFEMGATLTGVKLFRARGYAAIENIEIPLANGELLPVVRMGKQGSRRTL